MPSGVLATKLFLPGRRDGVVVRAGLGERLDASVQRGHRLTLVSAPAGFGKTTLVGEWAARQERVGWLSLDEADNVFPRFLVHLWAALSQINPDLEALTEESLSAAPTTAALTAVVNEFAEAAQRQPDSQWVLVLDDYHVIEAPDVHEAVTFLLEHMPDQMHLVVATRSDPPFPLSRLRTGGQLTEVRADDLRFGPADAQRFLNEVMGLELSEDDVRALDDRTEGWIAGLQLAALSLRGVSDVADVSEFIADFTGSNRFVIDYLVDEVLARQGEDVSDFLLSTSILDRLTSSLCDAVTGRTDSTRRLTELDRANMFLVPLDANRTWYRYHHLFRDVLRARLGAERPEQLPALHQAASAWYAAHDLTPDAVRHALAAADYDRAAYLIEEAIPELRRTRQDGHLLEWLRSLPTDVVRRSPVLSVMSGWSLMMAGDLNGMERRLDDAEATLAAGARDPTLAAAWAETEDLRTAPATLRLFRAALAQARGDVAGTVRQAQQALDLAGPEDHLVRGGAGGFLGLAAWAAGDVQDALTTFSAAMRSLHAAGNLTDELDSAVVLGDMWITAGRPSRARRVYEQSLRTATANGRPYPRATADLHVGLADLDRELNELSSAEEHLETARLLGEHGSITENRHRWYVVMAQVRAATGDYATALQLLDEAETLYRPGTYPDVRPIAALRARVYLAMGDLIAAGEWADSRSAPDDVSFLREYENLTLVRLQLARGDDALPLLDRLDPGQRGGSLLEIGVLRALALDARGDRAEALAQLDDAMAQAPEVEHSVRLFLDEGAPMLALLHASNSEHARRLLAKTPTTGSLREPLTTGSLREPLTDRELDVLRLLDTELTGPEIARRIFVSLNTLRTHTKRIFTKLDVNTRSAAVRRARERGLL
ncbi:MAG TPA: LuxR C-terminal-related transcriptional regulator [Kribbella sp.]